MSTFRLYLWKEWREQRGALFALALMLPVLVAAVGFSLPRNVGTSAVFVAAASVLALIVALVAVEGELLTLDPRRSGQWHERLPCGLAGAFPAKLVIFLVSTALALLFGILLATVVVLARGGRIFEEVVPDHDFSGLLVWLGLPLAMGPWTFAASAWCSRGAIAFGAGTLLACGLGFPLLGFFNTDYQYERAELIAGVTLFLGGALVSAWLGFVHGASLGRGLGRAAWVGGGSGALALAPIFGWGVFQLREREAFDIASPNCEVDKAWVSADGRVAVISARMYRPHWSTPGPTRTFWIDIESRSGFDLDNDEADFHQLLVQRGEGVWTAELLLSGLGEDDLICIDEATGAQLTSWDEPLSMRWGAGLGYASYDRARRTHVYHDPFSGRSMTRTELADPYDVWISTDGWFLWTPDWLVYDPYRDTLEAAPWIPPELSGLAVCPDGRLLAEGMSGTLALVDASTRSVTPLAGIALEGPFDVVDDDLGAPDELLMRAASCEYRFDLECLEVAPLPLEREEYLIRRRSDGTMVVWTPAGLDWRDPGGKTFKAVAWSELELSEEGLP